MRYAEVIRSDSVVDRTTFYLATGIVVPVRLARPCRRIHRSRRTITSPSRRRSTISSRCSLFSEVSSASASTTTTGGLLEEVVLHAGDAIVLIHGVHAIRVIEDMQAISVKQGPFLGDAQGQGRRRGAPLIPVFEPELGEDDIEAVVAALRRGEISGSFGQALSDVRVPSSRTSSAARYGVAVSSGTTALQLAVRGAGIGPGDEVLISASTNIATALAVVHNGAHPRPGRFRARDLESGSRPDRIARHAADESHHPGPSCTVTRSIWTDCGDLAQQPRSHCHRGLRRVARCDMSGTDDRQFRRDGVFQFLRQQGDHDRRRRDGQHQ